MEINIQNLSVSYHGHRALWGIHALLPAGKLINIIGPNGAGKSSLLKAMMGLLPLDSGTVLFGKKTLRQIHHKVSYVPQRKVVDWQFPITVYDVVMMGRYSHLGWWKRPSKKDHAIVEEALERARIGRYAHCKLSELSGGQQQRVFIARALAQEADVYLMDEPLAAVDASTSDIIVQILKGMAKEGKTIVVVNHDLMMAQHYFEWSMLLNMRLVVSGPTSEVLTLENLERTYGARLSMLSKVNDLLRKQHAALTNS